MRTSTTRYRFVSLIGCVSMLSGLFPAGISAGVFPAHAVTDTATLYQPSTSGPDAITNPISIARLQTSYTTGTTEIAFTLTNNLLPRTCPKSPSRPPSPTMCKKLMVTYLGNPVGENTTVVCSCLPRAIIKSDLSTFRNN
jgi:hypothetical protein